MLFGFEEATDLDTAFCLKAEGRLKVGAPHGDIGPGLVEWHLRPASQPELSVNVSIEERAQLVREIGRFFLEWALNGSEDPEVKCGQYDTLGSWMDAEYLAIDFPDKSKRGEPARGWILYAEEIANLVYQSLAETASGILAEQDEGPEPSPSDPLWREIEATLKPAETLILSVVRALPTQDVWDRYVFQVRQTLRDESIDKALAEVEDLADEQAEIALVAAFVRERFADWVGRPLTYREESELIGRLPGMLENVSDDLLVALMEHHLSLEMTDSAWVAIDRVIDAEFYRRRPVATVDTEGGRRRA